MIDLPGSLPETDSSSWHDAEPDCGHQRIWLASYPRSGNTWLRIIINECFGSAAASLYSEDYAAFPQAFGTMLGRGRASRFGMVKTHGAPANQEPAIYLVRDGRAAVVSYYHYCRAFEMERTIEAIIAGETPFGSWSNHVLAWAPRTRPDTLLLRFEDIVSQPDQAVEAVAGMLNCRPSGRVRHDFGKINALEPRFFRSGSNQRNIAELNETQLAFFEQLHGATMRAYGYS